MCTGFLFCAIAKCGLKPGYAMENALPYQQCRENVLLPTGCRMWRVATSGASHAEVWWALVREQAAGP